MKTVVFELTMPNRGSWNGRWSGECERHLTFKSIKDSFAKELDGKSWSYCWDDGWCALISASIVHGSAEGRALRKANAGFCGYDWMVNSILACGEIRG